MTNQLSNITEIFSSVQGEGPRCGERHIFIRFAGCNLDCTYCDTPTSKNKSHGKQFSPDDIIQEIKTLPFPYQLHSNVVLTGGEPLLSSEFICLLAPKIRNMGLPLYLETNGTLNDELKKVIEHIDIISCDFKLPCYVGTSKFSENLWDKQKKFLTTLRDAGKEHWIKIVFSNDVSDNIMRNTCEKIAGCGITCPIILQPMSENSDIAVSSNRINTFQEIGLRIFRDVRVIPQIHKLLKIR